MLVCSQPVKRMNRMTKHIIMCDLDGCLNYYPDTFLQWVKSHYGIYKEDIDSLKSLLTPKEYEELKHEYRTCGVKRTLAVRNGAADVLREIRELGKKIWIFTSRPTFEPVKGDTEYWLKINGIIHDRLIFLGKDEIKESVAKLQEEIWFVIEDDFRVATFLAEQLGMPVFLFGNTQGNGKIPALVTRVKSWHDIRVYRGAFQP